MTKLFNELEMDIYFSGHEHLHWDERIDSTMNFRQVIVGTASGTYNFPVKVREEVPIVIVAHARCHLPTNNLKLLQGAVSMDTKNTNKTGWK